MATIISICNSALLKLGADRITSLTENRRGAILCNEQYDKMRQEVLRAHPWNFAIARVTIAPLVAVPEFEFTAQFQLPIDCLRVLNAEDKTLDFKIEGRVVLANVSELKIKYIKDITDASIFDPCFSEALAARLAADLAFPLVQSNTLHEQMLGYYDRLLRQARTTDGQEGRFDKLIFDTFLNARL